MLETIEHALSLPSPLDRLPLENAAAAEIEFFIKRDDLIDPLICGNKWRKLKYNLSQVIEGDYKSIITFGGAYSNHLVATAAVGAKLGLATIGIIRSYKQDLENPSITLLKDAGMILHFVSPDQYNLKSKSDLIQSIIKQYAKPYVLEEGGTNKYAILGVKEMMSEVFEVKNDFTHVVLGIGTGGTLAGVAASLDGYTTKIVGISPFKGDVNTLAGFEYIKPERFEKIQIIPCFPPSRFGAYNPNISGYIKAFKEKYQILLDPIYTVKVMMTLDHLVSQGFFSPKSKVLIIHTGGLQGVAGY